MTKKIANGSRWKLKHNMVHGKNEQKVTQNSEADIKDESMIVVVLKDTYIKPIKRLHCVFILKF